MRIAMIPKRKLTKIWWTVALLRLTTTAASPSAPFLSAAVPVFWVRCGGGGGGRSSTGSSNSPWQQQQQPGEEAKSRSSSGEQLRYGRIADDEFRLTPEQIRAFREEGCVTIPNVLTAAEVKELETVFDRFVSGEIAVPGKDFCDMSQPFGIPYENWSIVNCMLPATYHPPLQGNIYERLTQSMAQQLVEGKSDMVKDYDQFLNKRPGKVDAVFAWHQDMAYWPSPETLAVKNTDTCTFSLAIDDSDEANGCLRYVARSGVTKTLRPHRPLASNRDEGHALTADVAEDEIQGLFRLAPARSGSVTIHDEYVVHGSGGNTCPDRQRRTYVIAYRDQEIVEAERAIGFTHSHNDVVNWDTFADHCRNQDRDEGN
jgi:phytanoyl-CoA hydroxylase